MSEALEFLDPYNQYGLPEPEVEYCFHPPRKWRIDYAFLEQKIAVEIDGGAFIKGRHTRGVGFIKDMEKHNQLVLDGWMLLRFTPDQVQDGYAGHIIQILLNRKEEIRA